MRFVLPAGPPLAAPSCAVGHGSATLIDSSRDDRVLGLDCWYPAYGVDSPMPTVYELLPGIGVTAAAGEGDGAISGAHPLLVWSHGRTGTRTAYVMLCEGLAARGYVVVAPDHPGDTLADWMTGTAVDDATNERQRVADVRFVLDVLLGGGAWLDAPPALDAARVTVAGHSYGAYTALALAGSAQPEPRIRAVAGLQSLTRTLSAAELGRITVPTLLVVGTADDVTPPTTDADAAFRALGAADGRRVDIERAGHQACSDVGLYLELISQVEGIPDLVRDFVLGMATQVTGTAGDPWRLTVGLHLRVLAAWLDDVNDRDREHAEHELEAIRASPGLTMRGAR